MAEYFKQPKPAEVFGLEGQTDVILRRDIRQEVREDGEVVWVCDEAQGRFPGKISLEEVTGSEAWWAKCKAYRPYKPPRKKTVEARLDEEEATTDELAVAVAEMLYGGETV